MPKTPAEHPSLAIKLDARSDTPLQRQLYSALRERILRRTLAPGMRLPATRALAHELGVARTTVVNAYEQLFAEGYLNGKIGAGTYVSTALSDEAHDLTTRPAPFHKTKTSAPKLSKIGEQLTKTAYTAPLQKPRAFIVGMPDLDHFPREDWARISARRLRQMPSQLFGFTDSNGYLPLREAIAARLRETRAMLCDAQQIIIVVGVQQAIQLATRVLLDVGDDVWIEDPSYIAARATFTQAGAKLTPVPVDDEGINVAHGVARRPHARMAYVTPSHQYPLGVTMSLARRLALLDWAARERAWIIEDDYDNEFRYSGRPLAALRSLDAHDRVIYVGTFSKTLSPLLRIGFMVAPSALTDVLSRARAQMDRQSSILEQIVLADFMEGGFYARHVRRMRELYAERQHALLSAARQHLYDLVELNPCNTGLQLIAHLRQRKSDALLAARLARADISAVPLSSHYSNTHQARNGLLMGYAAVDAHAIARGVGAMARQMTDSK
jgi:GntR family transcriptional regulator/MocR family aminotransferase